MATCKRSYFIDQRSGFKLPYKKARRQWDGLIVGPEDFDEKHPQLTPPKFKPEGKPLKYSSPDNDDDGGVALQLDDVIDMTFGDNDSDALLAETDQNIMTEADYILEAD